MRENQLRSETVITTRGTFTVFLGDLYPEARLWPATQAQAEQIGIAGAFADAALAAHIADDGDLVDACQSMASGPDYFDLIEQSRGYLAQVPAVTEYIVGFGSSAKRVYHQHWIPLASIPWMLSGIEKLSEPPYSPNKAGNRFNAKVLNAVWRSCLIRGLPTRTGFPDPDDLADDLYAPLESLMPYVSL